MHAAGAEVVASPDSNDTRMQQVMYANGKLWGALDTAVNPDAGPQRAGIGWYIVKPDVSTGSLAAKVALSGYLGATGYDFTYPAIGVTPSGRGVMAFTATGNSLNPSGADRFRPIASRGAVIPVSKRQTFLGARAEFRRGSRRSSAGLPQLGRPLELHRTDSDRVPGRDAGNIVLHEPAGTEDVPRVGVPSIERQCLLRERSGVAPATFGKSDARELADDCCRRWALNSKLFEDRIRTCESFAAHAVDCVRQRRTFAARRVRLPADIGVLLKPDTTCGCIGNIAAGQNH